MAQRASLFVLPVMVSLGVACSTLADAPTAPDGGEGGTEHDAAADPAVALGDAGADDATGEAMSSLADTGADARSRDANPDAPVVCAAGLADCDGLAANGCETKLDDDTSHCGACTHACVTGGTCAAGKCTPEVLAWDLVELRQLHAAGSYLFASTLKGLFRIAKDGSSVELWDDLTGSPTHVLFVGDRYYTGWCSYSTVTKEPARCFDEQHGANAPLATDGVDLYYHAFRPGTIVEDLRAVPLTGGTPRTVLPDMPQLSFLGVMNGQIYFQSYNGRHLSRVAVDGSGLTALPQLDVDLLRVDGTRFWGLNGNSLYTIDGATLTQTPFVNDPQLTDFSALALSNTDVYYGYDGVHAGGVKKVPRTGGTAVPVIQEGPQQMVLDEKWAYIALWGHDFNGRQGNVIRVPR